MTEVAIMYHSPFIRIARPANSLAVGALVSASCLVAGVGDSLPIALAVLGSVLVAAGGYVLNDVFDYEADGIVHRDRVLPKGEMSQTTARVYALALLVGSPLLFLFINRLSFVNASLAALLLFFYSWKLKRTSGVIGNLAASLLASNGALIGGFVGQVANLSRVIPLAICVFFATISREIVKDIEDLPGDRTTRSRTLPMLIGCRKASRLAAVSLCLAILTTYLPYQQAVFGKAYLVAASAVNIVVLYTAIRLALGTGEGIGVTQRLIKAEMFLYILIFLLTALFGVVQGA